MTCPEVDHLLEPFVDGEIAASASASLQAHLATCVACRRQLAEIEALRRLVRRAPYHVAPDHLRARLLATPRRSRLTPTLLALAATVTLAASLGGVMVVRAARSGQAAAITASLADDVVGGHVRAMMGEHLFDVRWSDEGRVGKHRRDADESMRWRLRSAKSSKFSESGESDASEDVLEPRTPSA